MDEKRNEKTYCPECGLEIADSQAVRCPRCNHVLLKLVSCSGACSSCAKGCNIRKK